MAQEYPLKRYKTYPAALIGNRQARFKDSKGRWAVFKPGKPLILVLGPKTRPAASRRPSRPVKTASRAPKKRKASPPTRKSRPAGRKRQKSAKPAAKSPAPRKIKRKIVKVPQKPKKSRRPVPVVKKPKRKAPARPVRKPVKPVQRPTLLGKVTKKPLPRRKAPVKPKRGPWITTDDVLDRLEREYVDDDGNLNLKYEDVSEFTGHYYAGKGIWHKTVWPNPKLRPEWPIKSVYIFAIYQKTTYDLEYSFVGKQLNWHSTPEWIMNKFSEDGEPEYVNGKIERRTILETLLETIFHRCGQLIEIVGIRFSNKKAPPRPQMNPKKRKKKK